jgi:single-strand DNA-binding protein
VWGSLLEEQHMNQHEATGHIVKKGDVQTIPTNSGNEFQKAELVIEIPEQKYNNKIQFEVTRKALSGYDALRVGDLITVHFDLSGRKWKDRYFVNLNAWRIERCGGDLKESGQFDPQVDFEQQPTVSQPKPETEDDDDLEGMPF